jgi:hypothetical protein
LASSSFGKIPSSLGCGDYAIGVDSANGVVESIGNKERTIGVCGDAGIMEWYRAVVLPSINPYTGPPEIATDWFDPGPSYDNGVLCNRTCINVSVLRLEGTPIYLRSLLHCCGEPIYVRDISDSGGENWQLFRC